MQNAYFVESPIARQNDKVSLGRNNNVGSIPNLNPRLF